MAGIQVLLAISLHCNRPVGYKPASAACVHSVNGLECLSKVNILIALQVERKVVKHSFAELRRYFKIKVVNSKNREKLFPDKY